MAAAVVKLSMLAAAPLRLLAFDADDLAVISTHLQDSEILAAEMAYLPRQRRFALIADRFDWCAAQKGEARRCRTGLHFEGVTGVRRSHFEQDAAAPVVLLSITFLARETPAGEVLLHFEGGGAIRLDVECLEAAMADLGPVHACRDMPAARV